MRLKSQTWDDVRDRYQSVSDTESWVSAMLELVDHISSSPVGKGLYPWTSMFDLIITQTPTAPFGGSYPMPLLKISPKGNGKIEFRYADTGDEDRQWIREVHQEQATSRFDGFIDQLGWLVKVENST